MSKKSPLKYIKSIYYLSNLLSQLKSEPVQNKHRWRVRDTWILHEFFLLHKRQIDSQNMSERQYTSKFLNTDSKENNFM